MIVQPGIGDYFVAEPVGWVIDHVPIEIVRKSNCPVAKVLSWIYNRLGKAFNRKTVLMPTVQQANVVDVALVRTSEKIEPYTILMPDGTFKKVGKFVGIVFAGSNDHGAVIKMANINKFLGINVPVREVKPGDEITKVGRTTGLTKGRVIATHATIVVNYPQGKAIFRDVIVFEGKIRPGDSGSPVF